MESLEKDIEGSDFGSVVYSTRVVRVDLYDKQPGWVVQMVTENGEPDTLPTRTLINSTGLSGPSHSQLIPKQNESPATSPSYVLREKGSYASYLAPPFAWDPTLSR